MKTNLRSSLSSQRGSTLMLVLIIGTGLCLVIASTLPSMLASLRGVHGEARREAAFHLAEGGIDLALQNIITNTETELVALGWTLDGSGKFYVKMFTLEDLGWPNLEDFNGSVGVFFDKPPASGEVRVWAKSTIEGEGWNGKPVNEYLQARVELLAGVTSHPFYGIVVTDMFSVAELELGTAPQRFDSYDSSLFPHAYTPGVNDGAEILIANTATDLSNKDEEWFKMRLGNAEIHGDVAIGMDTETPGVSGTPTITGSLSANFQPLLNDVIFPVFQPGDQTGFPAP